MCFKRRFIKNERAKTILLNMLKYLLERFIERATNEYVQKTKENNIEIETKKIDEIT